MSTDQDSAGRRLGDDISVVPTANLGHDHDVCLHLYTARRYVTLTVFEL